ncbi:uncharacterized protein LOC135377559 isoform X2 [Ornithodoros turicata]|uniref:uncharacterized protein LOC135377559 isoform X2 n=1 Tax=Ornithodoros turicata TaxID=34597 RepID=UPI0031393913
MYHDRFDQTRVAHSRFIGPSVRSLFVFALTGGVQERKAPLQATAHQGLPRKEEATVVRSPRGFSQESSPKYPGDMKFPLENTSFKDQTDVPLENTILGNEEEIIARCRLNGCSGMAVIARWDALFPCPVCKHFTCMKCDAIHESMTCEDYATNKNASSNVMDHIADEQTAPASPTSSFPSVEEEEGDGTGGVIVNCLYGSCNGHGFVENSATLAQCYACKHWTCRRCKASHDGKTCNQYKAINVDEPVGDLPVNGTEDAIAASSQTVQCTNPKCGSEVQLDTARVAASCPNMCGEPCYICPACNIFTCIGCNLKHEGNGVIATIKKMFSISRKDSTPKPVSNMSQGAVPKRKTEVHATETWSSNNENGMLSYRKCRNNYCVKYGDTHPGPCSQKSNSQCDKGYEALDDEACDSCRKTKYAMTVEACEHHLCSNCIRAVVENAYLRNIMCPVKQSSGRCSAILSRDDIKKNVSRQAYSRYKKMLTWEIMTCQNKKCHAEFCVDPSKNTLKCPRCKVTNCTTCRACHEGYSCEQYVAWLVEAMDKGQLEDPAEKEKRFKEQQQLYEKNIVPNTEQFDCVVCFGEVEPGEGLILKNCHHSICKDCLKNTIATSENAEVQCPCFAEDSQPCTMNILDDEIREILSPEGYEAFLEKGLIEAERKTANSFHCKTVNCRGWCIYDAEVNTFDCPVCEKPNCLRCEAIHPDVTCEAYQEDLKRRAANDAAAKASIKFLEDQLEQGVAMRCPTCKVIVIKRSGCDYMVCASCKTALCWATKGARWGPKGAGDNSGGCRCMVDGVKCHPTCTTCH